MSVNCSASYNKFDDRATLLAISDVSNINTYTLASSLIVNSPISMDHNRRLINEIIDQAFDERKGIWEASSSQCSSLKLQPSEYSYDKRLQYWKNILKERGKIAAKIRKETKKKPYDILFNRLVTLDERDKFTVKRVIDIAQRLKPASLIARQPAVLKEKCDTERPAYIAELHETLPKTERHQNGKIEIVSLPKIAQRELLGKPRWQGYRKPYSWLKSKHLENRIEECREDLERVLEYYPDTEHLQVVGEGLLASTICEHDSDIKIVPCKEICKISTDTHSENTNLCLASSSGMELPDYAFKINDQEFLITTHRGFRDFKLITNFSCYPFETQVKKIFTIQNIGHNVLTFEWVHRSYFYKNSNLLKCSDNEFVFDNLPFRLYSGEAQDIYVKFQPRRVSVVRSKWAIKARPILYKRKIDSIVLSFCGNCLVPPEYKQKLNEMQKEVIEKSNMKMMKKLTTGLSMFAIDLPASESFCPYERSLNDMELFEQLNIGFKCERHNDLELLKDLYKRVKKPRDKMWDLQVNTLKNMILKLPQAESRYSFFNQLNDILNSMKGNSVDLDLKICDNAEKYRSRFLYVRGIISATIDEWIDLVSTLEETFYQTTLLVINEEIALQNVLEEEKEEEIRDNKEEKRDSEEDGIGEETKNVFLLPEDEDEKRQYVVEKRVRKLKPYRDTLYMQTYTLLCDFLENIVNVIEAIV